ncbi:MAG: type I methionyl aminopeptidase [Aggregatilineales bacterium]
MSIETTKELMSLMKIGRIVGLTLQRMQASVRAGMTTAELDAIGADFLAQHGARPAPRLVYKFPGATCISINEEAAHGIPGDRVIGEGDLVNIDVSAELDGYFADTGATVPIPPVSVLKQSLCAGTQAALKRAIDAARAGQPLNAIGKAVEIEARRRGFTILHDMCGHGVGRGLHESPRSVPMYDEPRLKTRLTDGLVITIEPFLSNGATRTVTSKDGWTIRTPNGQLSAQYEHTIVIMQDKPLLVTTV